MKHHVAVHTKFGTRVEGGGGGPVLEVKEGVATCLHRLAFCTRRPYARERERSTREGYKRNKRERGAKKTQSYDVGRIERLTYTIAMQQCSIAFSNEIAP